MNQLSLTFRTLMNPGLFMIMIFCVFSSSVLVLSLFSVITWMTSHYIVVENRWLGAILKMGAGIITGAGLWFMLPPLTVLISGFFHEKSSVDCVADCGYCFNS